MPRTTNEIRSAFLDYFARHDHKVLPSGPLVPAGDPTLMFANAGMVQFKNVFTGLQARPAPRATTSQKCIRISGKHNDLENVGRTSRHHTFFEMLGNFSFGDYFKRGACGHAWELLTSALGLDRDRLWVSVFAGDDSAPADEEAAGIWRDELGVPPERILRGTAKDNFWAMGDTGPCGPCSEIMYDRGAAFGEASLENGERFFELWNLVFMQYAVDEPGGAMRPLPAPCIDTGAGLERIASVLQGVDSNYDTDVLRPLVDLAARISKKRYGAAADDDVSMRVIADHSRMAAHLITEGVFPEKTGREYVLRRVMRRAIRHAHRLGISDLFLHETAGAVADVMGDAYPELVKRRELIERVCMQEEERFRATLSHGLELLNGNSEWIAGPDGGKLLPGAIAFDLSATYGFPLDLIEVIGLEDGFAIDRAGWDAAEGRHKAVSGAGKIGEKAVAPVYAELHRSLGSTEFVGYGASKAATQVLAVIRGGATVEEGNTGEEVEVVLAATPFYGEAGGQVGDTGEIRSPGGRMEVADAQRPIAGLWVHRGTVREGRIRVGDAVDATIDAERRRAVSRHHTATHLLHLGLRRLLGQHATQKGSRVAPDGLRFDFSHFEPLTGEQLAALERFVTDRVLENAPVTTNETTYDAARATGAMAIFEETYGDVVRLVQVGSESLELCGGIHVGASGEIGPFFITAESGIAAGVRRIEAVAGRPALDYAIAARGALEGAARLVKAQPQALPEKMEKLLAKERELRAEVDALKRRLASGGAADVTSSMREIAGVKVLASVLGVGDPATLRDTADQLRTKLGSAAICLGGENGGKAAVLVALTQDLLPRLDANQLIRVVAAHVGGRGGGRPDLAQAGGPDADKLETAVNAFYDAVARSLGGKGS
ncbi:MAG: alanine--tRNA ligase [Proteobacteria bacterium]|jgi:alanyl-tRNA synthetase|nr:alanine--tRNA ligase [Pseudomonadota bacterium]